MKIILNKTMGTRATPSQWETIINILEEDEEKARIILSAHPHNRDKARDLWEEMAEKLNSVPRGGYKDPRKWAKAWADFKHAVKTKAARIAALQSSANYQPGDIQPLSSTEEKVVKFMKWQFDASVDCTYDGSDQFQPMTVQTSVSEDLEEAVPDPLVQSDTEADDGLAAPAQSMRRRKRTTHVEPNIVNKKSKTNQCNDNSIKIFTDIEKERIMLKRKSLERMNRKLELEERKLKLEERSLAVAERKCQLLSKKLSLEERKSAKDLQLLESLSNTLFVCMEAVQMYTST